MKKRFSILMTILCILSAVFGVPGLLPGSGFVPGLAKEKEDIDAMIASIPADWPKAPEIDAQAAILMDASSGEVLYAKNATEAMYPASTTKLMTALLTLEHASLQDIVSFSSAAVAIPSGSSHIGMRRGEKMVLEECLYGLLLPSANEVANALAEHVSENIRSFIVRMNERAYQLGAVNTLFTNANGLHEETHYTCAYDLALILRECVKNNTFLKIASSLSYVHHADELLPKDIPMTNTNLMIRSSSEYYDPDVICAKTGHTAESGYNLVTYAERDGMRLISVVMGCPDGGHFVSTRSLLDYGFNYFRQVLPAQLDDSLSMNNAFTASPLSIPTPDVALLRINATDTILLPDNVTFDMLKKSVEKEEDTGIQVITYTYQGYPLGSVSLSDANAAAKNPLFASDRQEITPAKPEQLSYIDGGMLLLTGGLIVVLVAVILYLRYFRVPKKKYK